MNTREDPIIRERDERRAISGIDEALSARDAAIVEPELHLDPGGRI